MNKNKDLAVKEYSDCYVLGAGKRTVKVMKMPYQPIKDNVLKFCSTLQICITLSENFVGVFTFTSDTLKKDEFLRSILFGRETTNFQFVSSCAINAQLTNNYLDYCEIISADKFDYSSNCGLQFENIAIENGAKKSTYKQDKSQCIDYTLNGKRVQAKCSLKHYGTAENDKKSYSFSKTNKSAF